MSTKSCLFMFRGQAEKGKRHHKRLLFTIRSYWIRDTFSFPLIGIARLLLFISQPSTQNMTALSSNKLGLSGSSQMCKGRWLFLQHQRCPDALPSAFAHFRTTSPSAGKWLQSLLGESRSAAQPAMGQRVRQWLGHAGCRSGVPAAGMWVGTVSPRIS